MVTRQPRPRHQRHRPRRLPRRSPNGLAPAGCSRLACGSPLEFNIDRHGDPLWEAFISTGLTVPEPLHAVPRSVFASRANALTKYYDQIAWFRPRGTRRLGATATRAGSFDFLPHVYTRPALSTAAISYRVSDHFPLWVELQEAPARIGARAP